VIVGSGPGGYVAAIRASQLGLRTAIIEADRVGGRCLNYACIPAKAVLHVADVLQSTESATELGITVGKAKIDFNKVQERRAQVITTLTGGVGALLTKNKVEVINGRGRLEGEGRISVESDGSAQEIRALKAIILATGSIAKPLPGTPFEDRVIDTEKAWALPELPTTLAVVGAGASGVEIASAYARLGSKVTLLEGLDRVTPAEDTDISRLAERAFKKQGIDVRCGVKVEDVRSLERSVKFSVDGEALEVEWLVVATGRGADTKGLGLDAAGVQTSDDGLISVDASLRTTSAGVWAIGDLVRGPALAHKASDEGIIAVEDAAGHDTHALDIDNIPRATFCSPNIATVGLTEADAIARGFDVIAVSVPFSAVGAGAVYGDRTGMVKLIGERRYGALLGGHIIGSRATDLIQQVADVRALEGGFPELARICHGHPTFSEAVMEAARAADGWLIHG
jgi:dihydrolipoamide dehydrogenase